MSTTFALVAKMPIEPTGTTCIKSGCSGQVCSDHNVISTCEYREEYACYKSAVCERQADGNCGWTQTKELEQCLNGDRKPTNPVIPIEPSKIPTPTIPPGKSTPIPSQRIIFPTPTAIIFYTPTPVLSPQPVITITPLPHNDWAEKLPSPIKNILKLFFSFIGGK